MKVDITHGTSKGGEVFFKKTYPDVTVHVQFSQEELQVINNAKLEAVVIAQRPPRPGVKLFKGDHIDDDLWNLKVRHLVKGPDVYQFLTDHEGKTYHQEVLAGLQHLSNFLKENAKPLTNTSIEM